jgi:hypothetical protein
MSQDSFTEVTNESWFGRIGGAIKGLLFGLILIVGSFPLLFLNEGCAVKREKTLKEGAGTVVSVASDKVQESNRGKLVHLTGNAATDETLTDSTFGVSAKALKLKRTVEMYQWKETSKNTTEKKLGGGTTTTTTYSYEMEWSKGLIDSSHFKKPEEHKNPATMPYSTSEMVADKVSLGAFVLSKSLINMIDSYEPLSVTGETQLPEALKGKAQLQGSGFYIGANPSSPAVGDTRIKFEVIKPSEISVMAQQVNNTFEPYTTKVGGTIELLETGAHSAAAMIQTAQDNNTMPRLFPDVYRILFGRKSALRDC